MAIPENFKTVVRSKKSYHHQSRLKSYVLVRPPYKIHFSIAFTRLLKHVSRYPKSVEINLSPDTEQMIFRFSDMQPDDIRFSVPRNNAEAITISVLGIAKTIPDNRRYMLDEKRSSYPEMWFYRVTEKMRNSARKENGANEIS